jgi:hypothetical protein
VPVSPRLPTGMSATFMDGSCRWSTWGAIENYYTKGGQVYFWPRPE